MSGRITYTYINTVEYSLLPKTCNVPGIYFDEPYQRILSKRMWCKWKMKVELTAQGKVRTCNKTGLFNLCTIFN